MTPPTVALLQRWLPYIDTAPHALIFPTSKGGRLSRDAVGKLLRKHTVKAAQTCPSLATKNVTPHTLRHTTAMLLLHAGVDITVIALWLGNESVETTQIYLHADMQLKEQALAQLPANSVKNTRRYQPPDDVLNFLKRL